MKPEEFAKFKAAVSGVARRLGADPEDLMAVMAYESAGKWAGAVGQPMGKGADKGQTAVGLIQFTPSVAKRLGTSREALLKMPALEQLQYVEKYLSDVKRRHGVERFDLRSLYSSVFAGRPDAPLSISDGYNTLGGVLKTLSKRKGRPDEELLSPAWKPAAQRQKVGLDLYRDELSEPVEKELALKSPAQLAREAGITFEPKTQDDEEKARQEAVARANKATWEFMNPGEPMPAGWTLEGELAVRQKEGSARIQEMKDEQKAEGYWENLRGMAGLKPGEDAMAKLKSRVNSYKANRR